MNELEKILAKHIQSPFERKRVIRSLTKYVDSVLNADLEYDVKTSVKRHKDNNAGKTINKQLLKKSRRKDSKSETFDKEGKERIKAKLEKMLSERKQKALVKETNDDADARKQKFLDNLKRRKDNKSEKTGKVKDNKKTKRKSAFDKFA